MAILKLQVDALISRVFFISVKPTELASRCPTHLASGGSVWFKGWQSLYVLCAAIFLAIATGNRTTLAKEVRGIYSAEELIVALTSKLSSIDCLECEYTVSFDNQESSFDKQKNSKSFRYARQGTKWHYTEFAVSPDGHNTATTFCSDDNLIYRYTVREDSAGIEVWQGLRLEDLYSQKMHFIPDELIGQQIPQLDRSITDALSSMGSRESYSKQAAAQDGGDEFRLTVTSSLSRDGEQSFDLSVILDPQHGFLPRKIDFCNATKTSGRILEKSWEILEFSQTIDEKSGTKRWFPAVGVLYQGSKDAPLVRMTIDKIRINPTLSPSVFQPEIPDYVLVYDNTSTGMGRTAIKGGQKVVDARISRLARDAEEALGPNERSWLFGINVIIVVCLCLGVVYRRLRREVCP